jgi:glucose/mannose-6-phosphate isomerase
MKSLTPKSIQAADPSAMAAKVFEFPAQLRKGWETAEGARISIVFQDIGAIVFNGMGGSAIAGDLVKALLGDALKVPMVVNRGYTLPAFAGPGTLFLASSYSGNTEETLSAAGQAAERGCRVICVTSGGKLGDMAREHGWPVIALPTGYPPRAALGFGLGALLQLFSAFGVGSLTREHLGAAASFLEKQGRIWADLKKKDNPAVLLAKKLAGRFPLLYGSQDTLEPVAFRWKCQFNENSKIHTACASVPEMNHNEIVGWKRIEAVKGFYPSLIGVFLRTKSEHPRIRIRMDVAQELVARNRGKSVEVTAKGTSPFEEILYLVHFGDVVSLYLAVLNGVDPTEIDNILYLKAKLGK